MSQPASAIIFPPHPEMFKLEKNGMLHILDHCYVLLCQFRKDQFQMLSFVENIQLVCEQVTIKTDKV